MNLCDLLVAVFMAFGCASTAQAIQAVAHQDTLSVISPRCVCGSTTIYVGISSVTDMGFTPFYRDGQYHSHNPNIITQEYRCDRGHEWTESRRIECWCGWPDNEKPVVSLPTLLAVHPTADDSTKIAAGLVDFGSIDSSVVASCSVAPVVHKGLLKMARTIDSLQALCDSLRMGLGIR